MRQALSLARRGIGRTSPNPAVGALLVRRDRILGRGWHHAAGQPHAEIEALKDARRQHHRTHGATLYVTLEPCSTSGRTPPCTQAIIQAGIRRVVIGTLDPNPAHQGRGPRHLQNAGLQITSGILNHDCTQLNEAFNHWIVHGTPWITVKAAMTLDGRIADAQGSSKWITGPTARRHAMKLRAAHDAILVGINTVIADDPALTVRPPLAGKSLRRIILDSRARTPLDAQVVTDDYREQTTVVVTHQAPQSRVRALRKTVKVIIAPSRRNRIYIPWLLGKLGDQAIASLLVEGGGEINASFLENGLAHRIAFFYAPKILADPNAHRAVAGRGARNWEEILRLEQPVWRRFGPDLFLTAVTSSTPQSRGNDPQRRETALAVAAPSIQAVESSSGRAKRARP
jgi:diaminohydroxyphosphoribosylaminopyrimidine deaminase/5-amino-6-(5-phosphoribosylamino)uracil reductase